VDLADQPPLAFERFAHLLLAFVDTVDRADEAFGEFANLDRRAVAPGEQIGTVVARLITGHRALQAANRQLAKGAVPAGGTGAIRKGDLSLDRDDYDDEDVVKLYRAGFDVLTWYKED
jgi:hypothetical protein